MATTGETSHRILTRGDKAWELAGVSGTWHTIWSWLQFQVIFYLFLSLKLLTVASVWEGCHKNGCEEIRGDSVLDSFKGRSALEDVQGELPQIYNIPNPFSAVVVSPAHRKPTCWLRNANLSEAKAYASRFQKAHKAVI